MTKSSFAFRHSVSSCTSFSRFHKRYQHSRLLCFNIKDQVEVAIDQKNGVYDYMTLPFNPDQQNEVEDFYGPIEILFAEGKGRGIFVTRDMFPGELLLVEKAFAFHKHTDAEVHLMDSTASLTEQGSQDFIHAEIKRIVNSNSKFNTKFSYLAHSLKEPNTIIPDMEWFRTDTFPIQTSIASDSQIAGAIDTNVFTFSLTPEPSLTERIELSKTLAVGVDEKTFIQGCSERTSALKSNPINNSESPPLCSAIWIVASFMNHKLPSKSTGTEASPPFFAGECGKLFIVYTLKHMKKGDEVNIFYEGASENSKSMLMNYWGISDSSLDSNSDTNSKSSLPVDNVSDQVTQSVDMTNMSRQVRRALAKKNAKADKKSAKKRI